jgi:outer membrane biosynthesis protein TonB
LFLLLATTLPAFAQKEEEKGGSGQKAQPAQHEQQPQHAQKAAPQHEQKAAPQHAQKAEPQRVEKAQPQRAEKAAPKQAQKAAPQRTQAQQPARQQTRTVASNRGGGGNYGRISNANYTAHFGQGHSFRMGHPQMSGGYNRFQYGGYSFGYNQGWPGGWGYGDDFYVVYINGAYYLCDLRFPGIQLTLNIF